MREAPAKDGRRRTLLEALGASLAVTAIVTASSAVIPDAYVAAAVGCVFLGATWVLVWRGDDRRVEAFGLSLGGLVLGGKLDLRRLGRSALRATLWAAAFALIFFVPFYFGWVEFWRPRGSFALRVGALELLNDAFAQVVIVALPEEAFYRGYLQSRLDEAIPGFGSRPAGGEGGDASARLPRRVRLFGASVGPAVLVTSAIFALGHLATIRDPARLAVFFPSLLFGWLRYRTGGIGAAVAFHAACNVFSDVLGKGFRVY